MSGKSNDLAYGRPLVALITDRNDLALSLAEKLTKKLCAVQIISDQYSHQQTLEMPKDTALFVSFHDVESISKEKVSNAKYYTKYNYVIFISLNQEKEESRIMVERKLRLAVELARNNSAKVLFIFPLVYSRASAKRWHYLKSIILNQKSIHFSINYLGHLVGPRMSLEKKDHLAKMLKGVVTGRLISIPKKEKVLYPVSIDKISKELIRSLFSFGEFGKETAIVSKRSSTDELLKILIKQNPGIRFKRSERAWITERSNFQKKIDIKQDLGKIIKETISHHSKKQKVVSDSIDRSTRWPKTLIKKDKRVLSKRRSSLRNMVARGIFLIAVLVMLPPSLILTSSTSLIIGRAFLERGNITIAKGAYNFSRRSSGLASRYFTLKSRVLGGSLTLSSVNNLADILLVSSRLGLKAVSAAEAYSGLIDNIFGEERYEPAIYADEMALELDSLYKEAGFMAGELEGLKGIAKTFLLGSLEKGSLMDLREQALIISRIAKNLPEALGASTPKTYLVLFQNNLEVRPTGGVIESFALITFTEGYLSSVEVLSVEQADKKLKGQVEPPAPIKNYLGKKIWLLRDSNWDPDFPTSAAQAEWFLDKEIDRTVDGVIAIDLDFVKAVLKETGPLAIKSLEKEVDDKNIYFSAQKEKKSDFFAHLAKEMIGRIMKLSDKKMLKVTRAIILSLEEKKAQVFFHQVEVQRAIAELGWDGAVTIGQCAGNCQSDWFGISEASLGEKSPSHLMSREAFFEVFFEEGLIKRKLLLSIENLSKEKYRSYIRVLSTPTSGFSPVAIKTKERVVQKAPKINNIRGHKEAGVYVEIEPKEKLLMKFSWEGPRNISFNSSGEYRLLWRKQAGIESFPIKVKVNLPATVGRKYISEPGLTDKGMFKYNTELSRDFVSRIYW